MSDETRVISIIAISVFSIIVVQTVHYFLNRRKQKQVPDFAPTVAPMHAIFDLIKEYIEEGDTKNAARIQAALGRDVADWSKLNSTEDRK